MWRYGLSVLLALWICLPAYGQEGQAPKVITEPIRRFGLGSLASAAYSPDGRFIATCGAAGAFLWDVETGKVVREFLGQTAIVTSVVFSTDGKHIFTGSSDDTIKMLDADTGAVVRTLTDQVHPTLRLALSPDERFIATSHGNNMAAYLWDIETGKVVREFIGHTWYIKSVVFSPDGTRVLTGSDDKTANLWDTNTGAVLRTFSGHKDSVESVAFSPDGTRVLTGSRDDTARLWDANTGAHIRTFSGHKNTVGSVAFSPTGDYVLTGSYDHTAKLWDAETGAPIRTFSGHTMGVISLFSPDGTRILTCSDDNTAKLWDANTGTEFRIFSGHTAFVSSVAFSPDGTRVLTGAGWPDYTAKLWNAETGAQLRTFSLHIADIHSVAFSPDGTRVLTGSGDSSAILWNVNTGVEVCLFIGHWNPVYSVAFSPNGSSVLTGSGDRTAKLWNANTGEELRTFSGHTSGITSVAFSPDGTRILTGSWDNTAKLWNAETGALIRTFTGHTSSVYSVAFSPDGTRVLTGGYEDYTARLWDANTGVQIRLFMGHTGSVTSVAFSSNGSYILTGSGHNYMLSILDHTAKLWDAETGAELLTFSGHTNDVNSVAFSPDGTRVLTGSEDGTARLWPSGLKAIEPTVPREKDKVLIVAGGGPYPTNSIATQTRSLAEQTHLASTIRGLTPQDILYLSSFDTPAENPRVDGTATVAAVRDAIENWSVDARRLTVFLLDHGEHDPIADEWYFYVDANSRPREVLSATAFDAMLDIAQTKGLEELVVVVDSCYAGGFVRKASSAPEGFKRVVVASTTDTRLANFGGGDNGYLSFTYFFLSELIRGVTIRDAYDSASAIIEALRLPKDATQRPWLDDDGDGKPTGLDGALAGRYVLGRTAPFGALMPELLAAPADLEVASPRDVAVEIETGPGRVDGAEAVVTWGNQYYPDGSPITDITVIPLTRTGATARWTGVIPAAKFPGLGEYAVVYTAYREDPLVSTIRFSSNALIQTITVGEGQPTPSPTSSPTPSPSPSSSPSPSPSISPTPSSTPTPSPTQTAGPSPSPSPTPHPHAALSAILLGKSPPESAWDTNGDGVVDIADILYALRQ